MISAANRKSPGPVRRALVAALAVGCWCAAARGYAAPTDAAPSHAEAISEVQPKIVKIYGAGGFAGLPAYQSGYLISADGFLLTVWSYVLDSDVVTVTLDDGRKFKAELRGIDPKLEVALLKIDAADLVHFELAKAVTAEPGSRVLAFSNLFGVATGDESASVLHGILSVQTKLEARRGAYETPYQGSVYVVDAMTNNPGAAGGALTNVRGELLAMLGKELRNSKNDTWLNYAVPVGEMREAVDALREGKPRPQNTSLSKRVSNPFDLGAVGLVLVPNVLDRTPPFVDQVRMGSVAETAGLRADDLILFLDNQLVQNCNALRAELDRIDRDEEIHLTVMRGGDLLQVTLRGVGPMTDK